MYSSSFSPAEFVAQRVAGRSKGLQHFALVVAGHLRPQGRDLVCRGVRLRELGAQAGVSQAAVKRIVRELCTGPDRIYEKTITMEANTDAGNDYRGSGCFPTRGRDGLRLGPAEVLDLGSRCSGPPQGAAPSKGAWFTPTNRSGRAAGPSPHRSSQLDTSGQPA
jgi:hypothetical protein